jgi:cytochrome c oxidase subunit 4
MSDNHSSSNEHEHDAHGDDEFYVVNHVASVKFYVGILAALMFFTLLTVGVASIHLGPLNLAVAVVIASIKATLVVMFFMHLKYDNKFFATIVICSLLFIGVFFAYTMNDTDRRAEVDDAQGSQVLPETGQQAPGGMPGSVSSLRSHERNGSFYAPNAGQADEVAPEENLGDASDTVVYAAPEGSEKEHGEKAPVGGEVKMHE